MSEEQPVSFEEAVIALLTRMAHSLDTLEADAIRRRNAEAEFVKLRRERLRREQRGDLGERAR